MSTMVLHSWFLMSREGAQNVEKVVRYWSSNVPFLHCLCSMALLRKRSIYVKRLLIVELYTSLICTFRLEAYCLSLAKLSRP